MAKGPVAMGGVGGSGTRVLGQLMREIGCFIGPELNNSNDNLWYALLFGRRDILLATHEEFSDLANLFFRQMSDPIALDPRECELVRALGNQVRHQHSQVFLDEQARRFIAYGQTGKRQDFWGWKVPYTHVLIDRFFSVNADLKYIHMTRNGLDMAFSTNQNQLGTWGPCFLNRDVENTPRDSLSYWCSTHKRFSKLAKQFPGRTFELRFEHLISEPYKMISELLSFLEISPGKDLLNQLAKMIVPPKSIGRYKDQDELPFLENDLEYLVSIGYEVS